MVTIRDVARDAGVSLTTASRVARGEDSVTEHTKVRVLQSIHRLGYQPNQAAQQLRTRRSQVIGIVVSDLENIFYTQVIARLEGVLKKKGYSFMLSFTAEDAQEELASIGMMLGARIGAMLITPVRRDDDLGRSLLTKSNIPTLQLYRNVYTELNSLVMDDMYGIQQATHKLLEAGHRKILLLDVLWEGRAAGYRMAHKEVGLAADEGFIQTYHLNTYEEKKISQDILRLSPTAIVAGTNLLGHSAITACRMLGKRIPEDVSMIIQDDVPWVGLLEITAIRQPMDIIADTIAQWVETHASTTGKYAEWHGAIQPEIIDRRSVRPLG